MNFKCLAAFAAMMVLSPTLAEEDCRLQLAASLPMTYYDGAIVVDAAIGDHPLKLIVDTGASTTMLRESVAAQMGLKYDVLKHWQYASVFGGVRLHHSARVKDFTLGNLRGSGLSVFLMPEDEKQAWVQDGVLGANVLSVYDVDFDFAHGKLNLFLPHRCRGKVVYWTQNEDLVAKLPIDFNGSHIRIPVQIEGKEIDAVLDTGASDTVLDQETFMPKFGLTPQSPGVQEYHDPADPMPRYTYTFKTLTLQGVTVNNAKVRFISQEYSKNPSYKMLLGMDVLRQLHLFIAYKEKMLFVTSATAQ